MENNLIAWCIVLATLVLSALGTAMIRNLLAAAVMLALTSAILTIALFLMGVQLAAVMELSVCAGLVTAVFASVISLTKAGTAEETAEMNKRHLRRFLPLPFIMLVLAAGILLLWPGQNIMFRGALGNLAVEEALWDQRALDILGLALVVLAGVLGVAVLFKERVDRNEREGK